MSQTSVLNVSSFFPDVCCKCIYLDVAYVFTYMLQVFYLNVVYVLQWFQVFLGVFASVSYACFKCFIVFRRMLQIVASVYFKTRSGIASPSSPSAISPRCQAREARASRDASPATCEAATDGHATTTSGHAAAGGMGGQAQRRGCSRVRQRAAARVS
jgi:hypothetical protein